MYKRVRFGFVLTEGEKRSLERLAEIEGGLSEAALLRRLIRRAAKEEGIDVRLLKPQVTRRSAAQLTAEPVNP